MIKCTVELKNALSNNLVNLSGYLLANGLISENIKREVTSEHYSVDDRAAKLVHLIQTKVKLNHQNYDKFVDTLKQADSVYYKGILKILSKTLREGNYGNSFCTIEYNSLTLQSIEFC